MSPSKSTRTLDPSLLIIAAAPDHPAALAIIDIISPPKRSPSPPLTAVVKKTPNKPYTPLRREFTLAKIRQENIERQRKEEEEEEAAAAVSRCLSIRRWTSAY